MCFELLGILAVGIGALLIFIAVVIFFINVQTSPYFLDPWSLSGATFNLTEKAMITFAMALLIVSGEIDLSVASIYVWWVITI